MSFTGMKEAIITEKEVDSISCDHPREHIPDFVPPQSFCYTNKHWCVVNG